VGARFLALLLDWLTLTGAALVVALVTGLLIALLLATLGESVGGTIAAIVGIGVYLGLLAASFVPPAGWRRRDAPDQGVGP